MKSPYKTKNEWSWVEQFAQHPRAARAHLFNLMDAEAFLVQAVCIAGLDWCEERLAQVRATGGKLERIAGIILPIPRKQKEAEQAEDAESAANIERAETSENTEDTERRAIEDKSTKHHVRIERAASDESTE